MSIVVDLFKVSSLPQRILLGGVAAALVAATGFNIAQAVENRHLSKVNVRLDQSINDPKTGFVVRLSQADTNTQVCKTAVEDQSTAIRDLGKRDAAAVAAVQVRYDTEHAARVRAENSSAAFLAHRPEGATLQARVLDVDAQIPGRPEVMPDGGSGFVRPMILAPLMGLAACGGHVAPTPPPVLVPVEVAIPVVAGCVPPNLATAPEYPDTDDALRSAPDAASRYQLLYAGRKVRIGRLGELEPIVTGCPKAATK